MTKWCVLITTYNRCNLLKEAINSALNQTIACEVLVIDDASTDETLEYLLSLDNQIKFYHNAVNCGHSVSVNRGVCLTQSEWIKVLDDDDYLAPNCLEVIDQAILGYPETVICSVQSIQVNETGSKIRTTRIVGSQKINYIPQEDIHYRMLIEHLPFGTPVQIAFRKDAFLRSGGWDSHLDIYTGYDDIDSWVRIAQFGDAVFINQPLAYRRLWQGGYNQKISIERRLATNLAIKEKIYQLVSSKHQEHLPSFSDIERYLKLYWSFVALKQLQVKTFLKLIFPATFSFQAWLLLLNAVIIPKE